MDDGAERSRRAMAARDIRPEQRRGEVIDILAAGLGRIAVAAGPSLDDPGAPGTAPASADRTVPESDAACLELSRCPGLSVPAGEPAERAPGPCRRAR